MDSLAGCIVWFFCISKKTAAYSTCFLESYKVKNDAHISSAIPTYVFHNRVSCSKVTAKTGAIAGLTKNAMEPVLASESLMAVK
jgi:hypothetical protein